MKWLLYTVRICKFSPAAHGLESAVHGHAAVPTHTCRTRNHRSTCCGLCTHARIRMHPRRQAASAGGHARYIKWRHARARVDTTDFNGLTSCSSTARHTKNTIQWPQCKIGANFPWVMSEVQIVLLRTRGVQLIRACARVY
jgi:hypothetical protein